MTPAAPSSSQRGGVDGAPALLGEHGFERFELLSTPRALAGAGDLAAAALAVHEVEPGQIPAVAAGLLDRVGAGPLVALGGGRVIDTAKALAAVTGAAVAALPTTMSGAEMTAIHRLPAGAEDRATETVRPRLVIADPAAMTSQPEAPLRASSMNALAHGADSLYTPFANPVSTMTALRGAALIAAALDQERAGRDRAGLALGSILCGYAIDSGPLRPPPRRLPDPRPHLRQPARGDQRRDPAARDGLSSRARAADALRPVRRGARHRSRRARAAHPRARRQPVAAWARSAPIRDRLERGARSDARRARSSSRTPGPPGRQELAELIERAW